MIKVVIMLQHPLDFAMQFGKDPDSKATMLINRCKINPILRPSKTILSIFPGNIYGQFNGLVRAV
jgi:hypothetical protein